MRPNSPKDRKRQLSRSSTSSDTSSDDSSPHNRRLQELKKHIDAHKRRKAKKDAAKLKRLRDKLSPSEFELLTRKKSSRKALDLIAKAKLESNSDSDSDESSSNSRFGILVPYFFTYSSNKFHSIIYRIHNEQTAWKVAYSFYLFFVISSDCTPLHNYLSFILVDPIR